MKQIKFQFIVLLAGVPLFLCSAPATQLPANGVVAAYQIGEQGANQRVWQKITRATDAQGSAVLSTNRAYVEIATGLNYRDPATGKWLPSREEIDAYPGGAIAQYGQHKVIFAGNLNTAGAIDLQMPDGRELRSDVLGLAYCDTASGRDVLIAEVKDCQGQIVNSNQVIYADAFNGISGNVRYRYTRAGLEQDVILLAQLPTPESFGLSSTSSVLQVLTEFTSAPTPDINVFFDETTNSGALPDESVDFGAMRMVEGKALLLGTNSMSTVVSKQWTTVNGRTVLMESVYVPGIAKSLAQLPASPQTSVKPVNGSARYVVSNERLLPAPRMTRVEKAAMNLAKETSHGSSFVLDYTIVNSGGPTVFQGDTTYYVSGGVNLTGAVTFEGGAVLKYAPYASLNTAVLGVGSSQLYWLAKPYRPVIFTAVDDDSVGDPIYPYSTGNPSGFYAMPALYVRSYSPIKLSNFRISYAYSGIQAVTMGNVLTLSDAQFVNCWDGAIPSSNYFYVFNALFTSVSDYCLRNISAYYVSIQNCTFNNVAQIGVYQSYHNAPGLTNCILVNVTSLFGRTQNGDYNGFYSSPTFGRHQISPNFYPPFQSAGGGNYYLAVGCGFQNVGTLNIDPDLLAGLRAKTTQAPNIAYVNQTISSDTTFNPLVQRDTNSYPDLGYHYDPIDYAVSGVSLGNATVAVYPGTVIAAFGTSDNAFGLNLGTGTEFLCKGLATNWNRIVAYNTVQEQSGSAWQAPTNGLITDASGDASSSLSCRFTDWSVPAQDEPFLAFFNRTSVTLRDCQFHGGSLILDYFSGIDPAINNCLFERANFILNAFSGSDFSCQNNLFWYGTFNFAPTTGNAVVQNNLFDQTVIPDNSTDYGTYIGGYNAYVTNCDQLQPVSANGLILTNPPFYFVGPLGNYYQPANSLLINAGSTNADQLGLYDYTVLTNLVGGQEIKETNSIVDIGYHYVAVDSNNIPLTTYTNGLPDYLVTSSTDPIPDWWEYIYFGNLDQATNGDYDNDGTNNLTEYQNGTDPNKISFSFSVPSQYVTNNLVPCVITVSGGVPTSIATLVDSTNFGSATWTSYTSPNITVNLGSTQGVHDVWIGLRGLPANAYQTWEETTLVLDSTLPGITITNPVNGVSFNAARVNVSGNFTAATLHQITVNDIVAFVNGTNFEAVNVPLAPGSNGITAVIENLTGITNAFSINVVGVTNSDGSMSSPVQLQAAPVAGFAPLAVTFSIQTNVPGSIQQVIYDFNGDDIADLITNNLLPLTYTYATNGEYFPVVTLQTSVGRFSSIGGWNAVALDPSNQPVQINVQSTLTQTVFVSITDPVDLKWDGTNLYVLSGSTATITEFATNGITLRSLSLGGGSPSGLDVDGSGNVYVAVTGSNQVWKYFPTNSSFQADTNFGFGGFIGATNGATGTTNGQFNAPFDVAVSPDGGTISVSDSGNDRIQQFDSSGNFLDSFGTNGTAIGQFSSPKGLTYDSVGTLYIVDSENNRIVIAQGTFVEAVTGTNGTALGQFNGPTNISVGERGVYVADTGNNRIQSFNPPAPHNLFSVDPSSIRFAVSNNLNQPAAVAVVDNLTNETFYVADTCNNRVVFYSILAEDPTPAWTNMTMHVALGDIEGALSNFSVASVDQYRQAFFSVGTANAISVMNQIGALAPVFINNDRAEYYFTSTIDGQIITFPVEFNKENGVWKVLEF